MFKRMISVALLAMVLGVASLLPAAASSDCYWIVINGEEHCFPIPREVVRLKFPPDPGPYEGVSIITVLEQLRATMEEQGVNPRWTDAIVNQEQTVVLATVDGEILAVMNMQTGAMGSLNFQAERALR